ncbi:MAG: PKD domain-containing protein [Bacteroidia bacterium]|nr:PKD domain-containing protein [Bacteroidia bacterium]
MKKVYFLMTQMLIAFLSIAQLPQYTTGVLPTSTGGNSIPFYYTGTGCRGQQLYPGNAFGSAPSGMAINKIYFAFTTTGSQLYTNFEVKIGQKNITTLTTTYETGLTTVLNTTNYTMNRVAYQWVPITLSTPFLYNPGVPIIIEINQLSSGGASFSTCVQTTLTGSARNYSTSYNATTASGSGPYTIYFGFDLAASTPPAPPIANFFVPPSQCQGGATTLINNSVTSGFNISHLWTITPNTFSYAFGSNANSINPRIIFNSAGTYNIKLRVTNNIGSDSITKTAIVTTPTVATMPDFVSTKRIVPKHSQLPSFQDFYSNCLPTCSWPGRHYEQQT